MNQGYRDGYRIARCVEGIRTWEAIDAMYNNRIESKKRDERDNEDEDTRD